MSLSLHKEKKIESIVWSHNFGDFLVLFINNGKIFNIDVPTVISWSIFWDGIPH